MKNLFRLQVFFVMAVTFLVTIELEAQKPVAITQDGKHVYMESDLSELPQERREALDKSSEVIIVSSKAEIDMIDEKQGLKKDASVGAASDEKLSSSNGSVNYDKEMQKMTKRYQERKISKEEYAQRKAYLERLAKSSSSTSSHSESKGREESLNSNGDVPNSKSQSITESGDVKEASGGNEKLSERDVVTKAERKLQEAESYEDLKQEKEEILEEYRAGKISAEEARALVVQYENAMNDLRNGHREGESGSIQGSGEDASEKPGNTEIKKNNSDKTYKKFSEALSTEREQLLKKYESGELTENEVNERYAAKRQELEREYNVESRNLRKQNSQGSEEKEKSNILPEDEIRKDLPEGMTVEEYKSRERQERKEDKKLREETREKLEQEGYSDDEIHEILRKKYPGK